MRRTIAKSLVLLVLVSAMIGCDSRQADKPPTSSRTGEATSRASQPMFKGVELYSWRDTKAGSWHYALLPGTNRAKPVSMILAPAVRIDRAEDLKKRLGQYAMREQVFWHLGVAAPGKIPEGVNFAYPEAKLIEEVRAHCRSLDIDLHVIGR